MAQRTVLFALALALAQGSFSQDPERAVIEGSVINVQTSRAIPRATVNLVGMKGAGSKSTRADGSGHFVFQYVAPGEYKLMAERQGFFSDEHRREYQPVFEISAGQHLQNMPVRLMPTAVVSGEIVDEYNDPLQNVEIRLFAKRMRLGQMFLSRAGTSTTDDRGQYRIPDLRPGKYYVVAEYKSKTTNDAALIDQTVQIAVQNNLAKSGEPVKVQVAPTAPEPSFTYPPLFYPATEDFRQAQALQLSPGDELPANFIFVSAPAVSIRGRIVNGMTGTPARTASLAAFWSEYLAGEGLPVKVGAEDGTFEVRGIAPGMYTLRAGSTEDGENYAGEQIVEVGNQGAQNVEIAVLPDFAAAGHVTLPEEGRAPRRMVVVDFVGEGLMPRVRARATSPEYKFDAQLRPEHRYRVNVLNLPDDYYLKAVTISGHEVPLDNLVVSGRRGDLELIFSARGGEVDGALLDQKNLPTRGSVLLVPDSKDPGPPELFPRVSADSKGKFTVRGIRPGSYRMVALESVALNDQITEPDFLRTVAGRGDLISVEESGKYTVALHLEGER